MYAFSASVKQRGNWKLRGKPLAVRYTSKRGVVSAASYETRSFGVHFVLRIVDDYRTYEWKNPKKARD